MFNTISFSSVCDENHVFGLRTFSSYVWSEMIRWISSANSWMDFLFHGPTMSSSDHGVTLQFSESLKTSSYSLNNFQNFVQQDPNPSNPSFGTVNSVLQNNVAFNNEILRADQPFVSIVSWVMWGLFTIYTFVTIVTYFFRRNKQPIKARSSFFVFILILAHYFSFSILSLRLAVGREVFPCALYLSFQFYGFPLIAIPYLVLCIRLYYISEMNRLQGDSFKDHLVSMGVDLLLENKSSSSSSDGENGSVSKTTTTTSRNLQVGVSNSSSGNLEKQNSDLSSSSPMTAAIIRTKSSLKAKVKEALHLTTTNDSNLFVDQEKRKKWSEKRKKRLRQLRKLARDDFIAKIFLFTFLLNSIIFLAYCGVFLNRLTGAETWNVGCAATVPVYVGSFLLILFYGIFILIFFYRVMRYAKESFGIKAELITIVVVWTFFLLCFVLLSVIPQYQEGPEYSFASAWLINIPLFITNFISVWIPLIRSFFWKNSEGKGHSKSLTSSTLKTGDDHLVNPSKLTHENSMIMELSSGSSALDHNRILSILYREAGIVKGKDSDSQNIIDLRIILFVMFHDEVCQKYFKEWCELEFSAENFLFLYFAEKVYHLVPSHTLDDIQKKLAVLDKLSDNFIVNGAPFELNLSALRETKESPSGGNALRENGVIVSGVGATTVTLNTAKPRDSVFIQEWNEKHTEQLKTILDDVEITCNYNLQDTWSRFILSTNFVEMVKELKKFEDDMKNINLV
ncbi:hypothetical protein FDP41_001169 [Naegleria fowleri]|uniref:RGS domain-containing protein n=1 Tax=Naegleria fowleri TaxID=5763 RepID=A0A6A5BXD3_NAEFO|nr:uncharacterized protein FDP41_001169 [Naegleria fowleri]KAF0980016.1 hypothetical protein FDP41_001169 [Naegleria fowleri]